MGAAPMSIINKAHRNLDGSFTTQAAARRTENEQRPRTRLLASSALSGGTLRTLMLAVGVSGAAGLALSPQQAAAQLICGLSATGTTTGMSGASASVTGSQAQACGLNAVANGGAA